MAGKPKVRKVGRIHKTFQGVLGEVHHFALEEYEALSLSEIHDVLNATSEKVKAYFELHSDYLATLEQPDVL